MRKMTGCFKIIKKYKCCLCGTSILQENYNCSLNDDEFDYRYSCLNANCVHYNGFKCYATDDLPEFIIIEKDILIPCDEVCLSVMNSCVLGEEK